MSQATTLNILLIEDDDVDAMNVTRAFKKANIESAVFRARDGVQALELLRAGSVPVERRLILLDLNMPRMTGIEFLRELRNDDVLGATPVVVLTTSDEATDKVAAYHWNVAGYLLKPVVPARFVELMVFFDGYWARVQFP